jgi:hypothetical protein
MLRSIAARPAFLRELLATVRMVTRRAGDSGIPAWEPGMIEALSLVVPPEYQRHVPPGGKGRLTTRLVQALADHARTEGAERVIYVVQPSNAASCIFFSAMGCEFAKGTYAGDPVYVYTHDLLEAAG